MKMLVMAAAALFVAGSATAGLHDFNGYATGSNDTTFGTNAPLGNHDNGTQHEWGTVSTYGDDYWGSSYAMKVATDGQSITLMFTGVDWDFDPDWYTDIWMDFMTVDTEYGTIAGVDTSYGDVSTDGTNIYWATGAAGTDGLNDGDVYITFTVPAPGALALLGLAGLTRRRRRQ